MKNKSIIFVFITLSISCKSKISSVEFKSLSDYYNAGLKSAIINSNPIIVENNKLIGLWTEIDLNQQKYSSIETKHINIVPKGYNILNEYFGENAENGILVINNIFTLNCEYSPETVYILDNKKKSLEEIVKNNVNCCYLIGYFKGLRDKKNNIIDITILSVHDPKIKL